MSTKDQIHELIRAGAAIIDVRTPVEFSMGCCPKSQNIPLQELEIRMKELDPKKTYILCCLSGGRSGSAVSFLKSQGFENVHNAGPWQNTLID
jgi:phage shock protein E